MAVAGQHSAQRKPLLRGQPHHRAVGPHRRALLLQHLANIPVPSPAGGAAAGEAGAARRVRAGEAGGEKPPVPGHGLQCRRGPGGAGGTRDLH